MIYNQNCNNLNINIKYFAELIEIDIEKIRNNYERFKIYDYVLEIFKLNNVNMNIRYRNNIYLVFSEDDLKRIFISFLNN